ncbi:MAG: ABC transporter permease subunit [Chthonomonas sp.]|nr:ABC transporter permease subunit [Chthonomonas sp.]
MAGYIYLSTLREFLSPRRLIIWIVAVMAVAGLGYGWLSLSRQLGTDMGYSTLMGLMGFRLLALVAAVFATAVIAGEVEQKTIVYLLTRPIPRPVLLVSRALAAITTIAVIGVVLVLVVSLVNFGPSGLAKGMVWRDVGVVALGAMAYGGFFLFISMLLNRAFLFCLLFAFGWEVFVPNMPGDLYFASLHSHMRALTLHPTSAAPSPGLTGIGPSIGAGPTAIPTGVSIAVLLLVCLVSLGLSALWFQQSEYVPREDAE